MEEVRVHGRAIAILAVLVLVLWPGAAAAGDDPPPLTLAGAIGEALRHSPLLRPAEDRVTLSGLSRQVAASRFALQITPALAAEADAEGVARHSVGLALGKRFSTGTEIALHADPFRQQHAALPGGGAGYALTVTQPLLRGAGPAATAELKDADRGVVSAVRSLDEARQDLVLAVAEGYFAVLHAGRLLESGERALIRARHLQAASRARTEVGLATRLDVLRADLLVSQAEAQLDVHVETHAAHLDRLRILLGRPLDAALTIDPGALSLVPAGGAAAAGAAPSLRGDLATRYDATTSAGPDAVPSLVAAAFALRTDISEARDRIEDSRRSAAVARWNLLPQVDLRFRHARRGTDWAGPAPIEDPFGGWRVGVVTSFTVDRAREQAAATAAQLHVRAAEQALADLRPRVEAEVRRAWRARERTEAAIRIHTTALDLAEQQLALAELRHERGLADNFDMIDAESNLFQAESALIGAEVARALADLALDRATGRLNPERYLP